MAAFLDGLMGALKGVGSSIGSGASKLEHGLMGAIDPASKSWAMKPGSGGQLPASADLAMSDLGDFKFGPGLSVQGTTPANSVGVPKPPGFFKRINTADATTGLSAVDRWDKFGAKLQDISDGGDRASAVDKTAADRISKSRQAMLNQQIDQLYPDDPKMRFLLKANPEKATAALADVFKSRNEAYTLGEGQRRGADGHMIDYAPKTGVTDGYSYVTGPDGQVTFGAQRGRTYGETETGRHNLETERLGLGNLDVSRGQLDVSRQNAGTAGGHLAVARDRLDFDRSGGVAGANGGGGAGGLSGMSTADLVAALRGAGR